MRRGSLWLALTLSLAPAMQAGVIVNTSLTLTSLTVTPNFGTDTGYVALIPGVYGSVYAQAADNLGEFDSNFSSNTDGPASTSAAVSLAAVSASADGSLLKASDAVGVNIPSLNAAVLPTSLDGNSQLEGYFELVDTTNSGMNPITVTIGATLTGDQYLFTDPYGISADSEVTFSLQLPEDDANGNPLGDSNGNFLFYDNPVSIGSNTTSDTPLNQSLAQSASLLTNTQYFFFLETDAESDGYDSPAPEPGSLILMATGLAGFAAYRLRRG